jgi:hypothetical protein
LLKAVARLKLNVHLSLCPSSELDNLLAFEQRDKNAMHAKIQHAAAAFALESLSGVGTKLTIPSATSAADVLLSDKDAADPSLDDDTTITGRDNDTEILICDGTYVCVLENNNLPTFGVLVHDVTEDNHYGTCIMADGKLDRVTFKTFAYNTLYKAMERNKEQTYRLMCPTSKLN